MNLLAGGRRVGLRLNSLKILKNPQCFLVFLSHYCNNWYKRTLLYFVHEHMTNICFSTLHFPFYDAKLKYSIQHLKFDCRSENVGLICYKGHRNSRQICPQIDKHVTFSRENRYIHVDTSRHLPSCSFDAFCIQKRRSFLTALNS